MIILEESVDLATPTGPMRTHLVRPNEGGRYPAIILYSEIFQVTEPIRRMAMTIAGHGFFVAIPEVFHEFLPPACVLGYDDNGKNRGNELKYTKPVAAHDDDARALVLALRSHPLVRGPVGAMGVCLGGHLALRCAIATDIAACACYYGTDIHTGSLGAWRRDDTLMRMRDISAEVLFLFGRQDPHVSLEGRRIIKEAADASGINYTWHEINAQHAFLRDEGGRYDPELARLAYDLALGLFRRRLRD